MNPATYGVLGPIASVAGQMVSPLGAPRRALWNAADYLTGGGTGVRGADSVPMPGDYADDAGHGGDYGRPKGAAALLPLLLGLGAGAATGGLGMGLAPAIAAGLGAGGFAQLLGENSSDLGDDLQAPQTSDLYRRLGIDSSPSLDLATELALDPMNLAGLGAWSKASQAGKAASAASDVGAAAQMEARLTGLANAAKSPSIGAARMGPGGLGEGQALGAFSAAAPQSELLAALESGGSAGVGAPDRIGEIRRRLMEMMGNKATEPMGTSTLTDMTLPALPIPGRPGMPATAMPTMEDLFINPMAIPKKPTSVLRQSGKPAGVL
jgi:hypothetical protein